MKNYIYTVLKDFARDFTEAHGVRPSKWDCVCYMNGYNPDESIHNIYVVLDVLYNENVITYSIPADGWGH